MRRLNWTPSRGALLRGMLLLTLIVMSTPLTGCQTTGSGAIKPTAYCTVFKPIYWSKQDTVETAKQVREHNAVWKEICGGKADGKAGR